MALKGFYKIHQKIVYPPIRINSQKSITEFSHKNKTMIEISRKHRQLELWESL